MTDLEQIINEMAYRIESLEYMADPDDKHFHMGLAVRAVFFEVSKAFKLIAVSEKERFRAMLKETTIKEINKIMDEQNISLNEIGRKD